MEFENLEDWKRSSRLRANIYKELSKLKDYSFRDQITGSGLSIPSNIGEGFERGSQKECMVFLSYAKGSSGELRTQIYIGMEIGYIDQATGREWIKEAKEISAILKPLSAMN